MRQKSAPRGNSRQDKDKKNSPTTNKQDPQDTPAGRRIISFIGSCFEEFCHSQIVTYFLDGFNNPGPKRRGHPEPKLTDCTIPSGRRTAQKD
jgi:hypothetical protein